MLRACSGFDAQKEAYFVLCWNIDTNGMEHTLVENVKLSKMDIVRMIMPKYDEFCEQCKGNNVK